MRDEYDKLRDLVDELPDFCRKYLLEGITSNSDLTPLNYARDLKFFFDISVKLFHFTEIIKEIVLDDLSRLSVADINLYLTAMKKKYRLSDKTIARRKSALSGLFTYLVNTEKMLPYNPVAGSKKVKISKKNYVDYLKIEEQQRLLKCIEYGTDLDNLSMKRHEKNSIRDKAIVFLFLDTGLRISELRGINIKDIDFKDCCVMVLRKGGDFQKVYFSDESKSLIKDYLAQRMASTGYVGDDPLFISNRQERISVRAIQHMVEKYVKIAVPDKAEIISPHKLRSSFAMEFYKHNKDILVLQERMGHKSIVATNIYAKAADNELIASTRNWRINK